MISEPQEEQATLYALELLDADEAAAFEWQIDADADLRELVRDLQETAALLPLAGVELVTAAPPALRERVLAMVDATRGEPVALMDRDDLHGAGRPRRGPWLPWAIAALFCGFAGASVWLYAQERGQNAGLLREVRGYQRSLNAAQTEMDSTSKLDSLAKISFCALDPTPEFTTAQPRAAVLWDAAHHTGRLRVNRLAPPAQGKDYQLWAVETGRKDTVSAGVVHVDAEGKADVPFQPVDVDGKTVVAVAISLEQAGGSPTNLGPILLLGKF